jgi:type I restriction enzyme S subunit
VIEQLPSGWSRPKLGELVTIKYGKGLPTKNLKETGYPVFGANGIIGLYDTYLYEDEQVLISCRGAYSGKINWSPKKCFVTNNSLVLEIDDHVNLDKRYLYYALCNSDKSKLVSGSAQPQVTINNAVELSLPLAPIARQTHIVAEIEKQFSRLDDAVANLKRVKANLKRYKASVLKAAVEGRLVETEAELARREGRSYETGQQLLQRILETRRSQWQGKGKYKEPSAPDTADLHELPDGWVWATAEQITGFITKGTTPAADKLTENDGDVQFLKVYNLTFNGVLNYRHKPAFVSNEVHHGELSRSKVYPGDVLINIVGPPLGQVSVMPEMLHEANINQAIARFRPISPIGSSFLALLLMSDEVMRWAIRRAKTTVGQSNLTLELCRLLPLPIAPLAEQHRIVAEVERHLSLANEAESQVNANLQRAERLRQAILASAFSPE